MSELVDLSKLDAPKVLEDLDFESLLADRKRNLSHFSHKMKGHFGKHD